MNIAYIFFGQIKNFDEKQFRAFHENIGKKLESHSVDYFLVTSKNKKYHSQRQSLSEGGEQQIDHYSIEKYFNFKSIFYDEIDSRDNTDIDSLAQDLVENFGGAWGDNSLESTKNSLRQLYSLEFFYEQFSKIEGGYDAFILSRSDLFHTHALSDQCLNTGGDIFIPFYDNFPQIDYGWFGGVNDRFAIIKNQSTLKTYCTRYSSIKNNPQFYHAEKYLKHRLNQEKADVRKMHNFEFRLIRANGVITDLIGIYPHKEMNCKLKNISKSFFINLERRKDRLAHILDSLPFFAERFDAVDSQSIQLNEEVKTLFPKTWKSRTKAEVCCAISHYRLWKKLLVDKDAENYLILEDDVVFKPGFEGFWNNIYSDHVPDSALLIYLGGCQPWNKPHYHEVLEKYNDYFYRVKKNDFFTQGDHFWHMNANSYILSKEAAGLLCQWVEQSGMDEAADNFLQQFLNSNILFSAAHRIFHMNPLMSYQLHEEGDNPEPDKNSDLRFAKEKFLDPEGKSIIFTRKDLFEHDFICEMFDDYNIIYNEDMNIVRKDSVIVYSDIYAKNINLYPVHMQAKIKETKQKQKEYFDKLKNENCTLIHLSDEHCHADIDHYENFKHVYRQYYRADAVADNVTFIPLGYKNNFKNE